MASANGGVASGGRRVRRRWCLVGVMMVVTALGLASRRFPLPGLLAEHTGDALYTVLVWLVFAFVRPGAKALHLGIGAFVVSAVIELAQLSTFAPLVALRATGLGALILGQGFQLADLLAYAFGAAASSSFDLLAGSGPTPAAGHRV